MASNQFSRLYDVERVGGDQRTRLAELLRSQGMNQPQGQMVSGWYVPPSWSQSLNSALQMGLGTYMGSKIDAEKKAETARLLRELGQGVEVPQEQKPVVFNQLEGVEGQTPAAMTQPELNKIQQLAGRQQPSTEQTSFTPAMTQQAPQPKFRPLTEEEKVARAMELAQINPAMAQVWSAQDTARQNRLTRAEERAADREWKEGQAKERFAERMDLARLTGAIAAGNRVSPQDKPLTEFQGKSVTFGTRVAQAHNILNSLEDTTDPMAVVTNQKGGILTNWMMPENVQRVDQAQRDFINAVLRQESGAAISASEFDNARKQYFPQPGDKPGQVAQKRLNREMAIKGFARQAGPSGGLDVMEVYNAGAPKIETTTAPAQPAPPTGRLAGQSMLPPSAQTGFSIRPRSAQ